MWINDEMKSSGNGENWCMIWLSYLNASCLTVISCKFIDAVCSLNNANGFQMLLMRSASSSPYAKNARNMNVNAMLWIEWRNNEIHNLHPNASQIDVLFSCLLLTNTFQFSNAMWTIKLAYNGNIRVQMAWPICDACNINDYRVEL